MMSPICTSARTYTIEGTQFHEFPETGNIPLVADMSSDIASRVLNFNKIRDDYAGAQKNWDRPA